jgi:hypothetical protein
MHFDDKHAGFAAVTLVESLLLHLQETGHLEEGERDLIYDIAIGAHLAADEEDPSSGHLCVAKMLKVLQRRADGVKIVSNLRDKGSA